MDNHPFNLLLCMFISHSLPVILLIYCAQVALFLLCMPIIAAPAEAIAVLGTNALTQNMAWLYSTNAVPIQQLLFSLAYQYTM